jgi:hypothetical protein
MCRPACARCCGASCRYCGCREIGDLVGRRRASLPGRPGQRYPVVPAIAAINIPMHSLSASSANTHANAYAPALISIGTSCSLCEPAGGSEANLIYADKLLLHVDMESNTFDGELHRSLYDLDINSLDRFARRILHRPTTTSIMTPRQLHRLLLFRPQSKN